VPNNPEITVDTSHYEVSEAVNIILNYLRDEDFID
jgi:hypothetical protein